MEYFQIWLQGNWFVNHHLQNRWVQMWLSGAFFLWGLALAFEYVSARESRWLRREENIRMDRTHFEAPFSKSPNGKWLSLKIRNQEIVEKNRRVECGYVPYMIFIGVSFCIICKDLPHKMEGQPSSPSPKKGIGLEVPFFAFSQTFVPACFLVCNGLHVSNLSWKPNIRNHHAKFWGVYIPSWKITCPHPSWQICPTSLSGSIR